MRWCAGWLACDVSGARLMRIDVTRMSMKTLELGRPVMGANSTSALKAGVSPTNSASLSTLFMTFVPVAIYAVVCITIFVCLRRRYPRVYSPRTFLGSLDVQYVYYISRNFR